VFSIMAPPIAIPMLAGIVWRRASNRGAIVGFLTGVTLGLVLYGLITKGVIRPTSERVSEIILALSTAATTLVVMVVLSLVLPARGEEKRRSEAFAEKLRTPVPPVEAGPGGVPAPFRVVGVCTIAVAAMLLAIQPFMGWTAGSKVNLAIAVILLIPGIYWTIRAGNTRSGKRIE
jgi:hypothetical protein